MPPTSRAWYNERGKGGVGLSVPIFLYDIVLFVSFVSVFVSVCVCRVCGSRMSPWFVSFFVSAFCLAAARFTIIIRQKRDTLFPYLSTPHTSVYNEDSHLSPIDAGVGRNRNDHRTCTLGLAHKYSYHDIQIEPEAYIRTNHPQNETTRRPRPVPYCANSWKWFWYCRCTQRPKNGLVLTATTPSAGTTVRGSPAPSADSCLSKRNRVLQVKSRSQ